jgi:putative nucleotidyltransferase with HDIG domain
MTTALIPEMVRKLLASQPIELPVFHPVALKLQRMLTDRDFTVDGVALVANEDPALASQMLKMANSPMYMGRTRVATIREVVIRLGAHQVINIAITVSQAAAHASGNPVVDRYMKALWQHSYGAALGARWLAQNCGMRGVVDESYLAALLHDIGKLFLLKAVERLVGAGVMESLDDELIAVVFEEMHVELGVRLVQHWNFPAMYCDAIRWHHAPEWDRINKMLACVRLVNLACRTVGLGLRHEADLDLLATEEAELLDVGESQIVELLALLDDTRNVDE